MIRQTLALFVDAYRELNARKLFWIVLALSLVVVLAFGSIGINERGISFLHWTFDSQLFNSVTIEPGQFYSFMFISFGIGFWLAWLATILALISTAGMFPDMISSGSIELLVSKPLGRVRLFLTKYATGLLFVALQVAVFSGASFLVIGLRGGVWEPGLFLAIPIVVLFFSYLFCICVLLGLLTRSTIAALLLTMLVWFVFFGVNQTDNVILAQRETTAVRLEDAQRTVERNREIALREMERRVDEEGEPPRTDYTDGELEAAHPRLATARERAEQAAKDHETWARWSGRIRTVKLVLPKTEETIALLNRYLLAPDLLTGTELEERDEDDRAHMGDPRVQERVERARRDRSITWVVGTSLLFEGFILAIGALIFARRDF